MYNKHTKDEIFSKCTLCACEQLLAYWDEELECYIYLSDEYEAYVENVVEDSDEMSQDMSEEDFEEDMEEDMEEEMDDFCTTMICTRCLAKQQSKQSLSTKITECEVA